MTTDADEAYLLDYARKHGVSWNALDMAVHTKKFADLAASSLAASKTREEIAENEERIARAKRRERMRARGAECAAFRKQWIEDGERKWRRNLRRKKEREQQILAMESEKMERKKAAREKQRNESKADLCRGLEWFENNMESLGIEQEEEGYGALKPAPKDYMQRMIERERELSSWQKSADYFAWIKKKAAQNKEARQQRIKRQEAMEREQERERVSLRAKKKQEKTQMLVRQYYRAVLAVTISKWRKNTKKIREQLERAARAAEAKCKFEAECTAAFAKFCAEARQTKQNTTEVQSRIQQVKRIARERKRKKATLVCQEVVDKLLDLTCCVLRERGEDRRMMAEAEWRHIKERFTSPQSFFKKRMHTIVVKGQDPRADEEALAEIEEFFRGCGRWAVALPAPFPPPSLAPTTDPIPEALATLRQVASENISIRPDDTDAATSCDEKRLRMCVTGQVPQAAAIAACERYHLVALTIDAAVDRALQLAAHEDAPTNHSKLGEYGAKLRSARESEGDDTPDLLLVDTLMAYLEEEIEEATSWALIGFPRTRIQAKLLENRFSNYSDPEVEEFVAAPKKKKKNVETPPTVSPFDGVLVVENEDLGVWWSSHNPRTIGEKKYEESSQRMEEYVEVFIEACQNHQGDEETELEVEVDAAIQSRIALLSPMQRMWRSHIFQERKLDLERVKNVLDGWQIEEDWYRGCLETFVYGMSEQIKFLANELNDETKAEDKKEAVEYAQDHVSVLAAHLIDAETSRFSLAIRLLDEHNKIVGCDDFAAEGVSAQLSDSVSALTRIASLSSKPRIGEKVESAMNALTSNLSSIEGDANLSRRMAGFCFVRRMQSTVCRLNSATTSMVDICLQ